MEKKRTHKDQQERLNAQLTPNQIRANKIEKCRVRGERRRAERKAEIAERLEYWQGLTPAGQLAALDNRPGESKKQRARIAKRIAEAKDNG